MASYAELQELYMQWHQTRSAYEDQVPEIIDKFLLGLSAYFQAPEGAIAFHQIIEDAPGILERYPDSHQDFRHLLQRSKDGTWLFCFSVKIMTKNPLVSKDFIRIFFPVRFKIRQSECTFHFMNYGQRMFTCEIASGKPFDSVYAYVYDAFDRALRSNPWDNLDRAPVGFDEHRAIAE
jgi:hypothetical protein